MNDEFKAGDVVQLKSGGPKMTVERFDNDIHQYYCVWFVANDLRDGMFAGAALKTAPPHEGVVPVSV